MTKDDRKCECGGEPVGYVMDRNAGGLYRQIGVKAAFPQCEECYENPPPLERLVAWRKNEVLLFKGGKPVGGDKRRKKGAPK